MPNLAPFSTQIYNLIFFMLLPSLLCQIYKHCIPYANKFPHDWTQKIISCVVSMSCQPQRLLKSFTPTRGQQLTPCLPHSCTVESVNNCAKLSQWEGAGVTHTEQNRPGKRVKGGEEGGEEREEERNSGPNSFSA